MKWLKYTLFSIAGIIALGAVVYVSGPKPKFIPVDFRTMPIKWPLAKLDSIVIKNEKSISGMKPDNEARIIWHSPNKSKTPISLVYMHGFSASWKEGAPINLEFAKRYGMNAYFPRFDKHGLIDTNAFQNLTPESYFESAQQALEIGKAIGEKVILMSCSSGSTLSIMLSDDPAIVGHIMYSPNIDIKDPNSNLVTEQWGPQITSLVLGSEYNHISYPAEAKKYWYETYHIGGIIALKRLIKDYMLEPNFKKVKQPLFMGYYYKNDEEQDPVVSVPRMLEFYDQVSTPQDQKRKADFANVKSHVICSDILSSDLSSVRKATFKFAEEVLKLQPVDTLK